MYQPLARVYRELSSALCAHRDIWAIAICGAALFSAAGVFETLYKTNRVDLVVAAIGILNSCFIEIRLIEYRAVQRSLFIVVLNIFLCISFALGSVSGLVVWPGLVGIFICAYLSARFADAGKLAGLFAMLLMLTFVNGLSLGAVPQQSVHYAITLGWLIGRTANHGALLYLVSSEWSNRYLLKGYCIRPRHEWQEMALFWLARYQRGSRVFHSF